MKTAEIAQRYLDYFEKNGHVIVPSASLVTDDPALLFTVAGMVPFIPYLSGNVPPPYARAADVQKCIRTNDIEEVGKTPRHGTFFQMLGNWSFGDYFKEGAITLRVGPPDRRRGRRRARLRPEGPLGHGLRGGRRGARAVEAHRRPPRGAHPAARQGHELLEHRASRPGRPCSEIFFDRGPAYGIDGGPATDDDRYVEIWNLVFMQYAIDDVRSKYDFDIVGELPNKNIDTGMGLERVAFIKQGVDNMYETDQVRPVLDRAVELSGKTLRRRPRGRRALPHRRRPRPLVAHAALGRRHAVERGPRLHPAPPHAPRDPLDAPARRRRPDVPRALHRVARRDEGGLPRWSPTTTRASPQYALRRGGDVPPHARGRLDRSSTPRSTATKDAGGTALAGDEAFLLHDTYGFPIDLTLEIAEEAGLTRRPRRVRHAHAGAARPREGRRASRASARSPTSACTATSAPKGETVFTGYTDLETESSVLGILVDGVPVGPRDAGPDRRGDPRRDRAVRRVRRPGRRQGRHRRPGLRARGARRAEARRGARQPHRRGHARARSASGSPRRRSWMPRTAAPRVRRTPRPTSCTPRCATRSARPRRRPARSTAPATCASTSRGASRCPTRRSPRSRRSRTTPSATTSR